MLRHHGEVPGTEARSYAAMDRLLASHLQSVVVNLNRYVCDGIWAKQNWSVLQTLLVLPLLPLLPTLSSLNLQSSKKSAVSDTLRILFWTLAHIAFLTSVITGSTALSETARRHLGQAELVGLADPAGAAAVAAAAGTVITQLVVVKKVCCVGYTPDLVLDSRSHCLFDFSYHNFQCCTSGRTIRPRIAPPNCHVDVDQPSPALYHDDIRSKAKGIGLEESRTRASKVPKSSVPPSLPPSLPPSVRPSVRPSVSEPPVAERLECSHDVPERPAVDPPSTVVNGRGFGHHRQERRFVPQNDHLITVCAVGEVLRCDVACELSGFHGSFMTSHQGAQADLVVVALESTPGELLPDINVDAKHLSGG